MDMNMISKMLPVDPQSLERLSKSPDGQMLMALLQKSSGNALDHATEAGKSGNYAEMTALIKGVMGSAEGKALLQRLAKQLQNPQ